MSNSNPDIAITSKFDLDFAIVLACLSKGIQKPSPCPLIQSAVNMAYSACLPGKRNEQDAAFCSVRLVKKITDSPCLWKMCPVFNVLLKGQVPTKLNTLPL